MLLQAQGLKFEVQYCYRNTGSEMVWTFNLSHRKMNIGIACLGINGYQTSILDELQGNKIDLLSKK